MWRVRVATEQFTLYPNQFPEDVPITQITEYNITINPNPAPCTDDVTLSLLLTENVIQHVPYVVCIIRTGSGATAVQHTSDRVHVYIPTTQPPQTTTTTNVNIVTNTTTVTQSNPLTLTPAVSFDSNSISNSASCRSCHDRVLLLCVCFYLFTNLFIHV
jgi:hypothetical protein